MERILRSYGLGRLQDFLTLKRLLDRHGKTLEDLEYYVGKKLREFAERDRLNRQRKPPSIACPVCGHAMYLAPVNTGPRNQTGDKSTGVWFCKKCFEEVWETRSFEEIRLLYEKGEL